MQTMMELSMMHQKFVVEYLLDQETQGVLLPEQLIEVNQGQHRMDTQSQVEVEYPKQVQV